MADLQMLAKYPIYGIILNVIPYTYPAIAGFLVVAAIPERLWHRTAKARIRRNGDLILGCLILSLILFCDYIITC
jgi:hypothetical protein